MLPAEEQFPGYILVLLLYKPHLGQKSLQNQEAELNHQIKANNNTRNIAT